MLKLTAQFELILQSNNPSRRITKTNELACAFSTQPRTPRLSASPERPLGDLPEQHRGGESRGGSLPVAVAAVRCRAGPAGAPAGGHSHGRVPRGSEERRGGK